MSIPADPFVRHSPAWLPTGRGELDIDADRLLRRLAEISRFGADPGPGLTRTGLSGQDNAAHRYLAEQCHQDGLLADTDQAGNLIVRRPGADPTRPVVLLGSHLDSVVNGGRLDGTYGVLAACEVVRVLAGVVEELPAEPVAIAFTNEEGAAFPYPFLGSRAVAGTVNTAELTTLTDPDGRSLRDALRAAGGDLDTIGAAAWPPGSVAHYLELHIEQGPVLETEDIPIGVVTSIAGRTIVDITVRGHQGHAGTTPMSLRRDALPVAARAVLTVERLAQRRLCTVGTVGVVDVNPNVTNVIPGTVRLTAEIRDGLPDRLRAAERALVAELAQLGAATDMEIDVTVRAVAQPVATSNQAQQAIIEATEGLGLSHVSLPSGAGHDAQIIAEIAPVGMIFVPSRGGTSHAPHEHTDDEHLVVGARALLHSVLHLTIQPNGTGEGS